LNYLKKRKINRSFMEEKKDFKPIIMYLAIVFGVQFVLGLILGIFGIVNLNDSKALNLISIAIQIVTFIVLFIMYYQRIISDFKRLSHRDWLTVIVATVIIIIINILGSYLLEYFNVNMSNQDEIEALFDSLKIPTLLFTVLMAPVVEELIFRYSFKTFIKNDILFVILSGLIFGVLHSIGIALLLYAYIGVSLAIVYLRTNKNIASTITIHMLNNVFAALLLLLGI